MKAVTLLVNEPCYETLEMVSYSQMRSVNEASLHVSTKTSGQV